MDFFLNFYAARAKLQQGVRDAKRTYRVSEKLINANNNRKRVCISASGTIIAISQRT